MVVRLLLPSGSHLATDATPSIGRRRVSCFWDTGRFFAVIFLLGFPNFCTTLIAEIQQIFVKIFGDVAENVAKICKNLKNSAKFCKICVQKSANFEIGAAQKNANLVDFEKSRKMSLWSLS